HARSPAERRLDSKSWRCPVRAARSDRALREAAHGQRPAVSRWLRAVTTSGQTPVKMYRTDDVPRGALDGESIAVLGYGNLGRSAALNLRDSGANGRTGNGAHNNAE